MQLYSDTIIDLEGNVVSGADILVLKENKTVADIFDANGNPISSLKSGGRGEFSFQASNGKYYIQTSIGGNVLDLRGPITLFDFTGIQFGSDLVSVSDPKFNGGAKGDGMTLDTVAIQAALNSGARYVLGAGKSYVVSELKLPAGVTFDGQGGELLTSGSTIQDVVATIGAGGTLANWNIRSNVTGVRKARYGVLVAHANTKLINLSFKDITYSSVFNDAEGTNGSGIKSENSGWDAISNYFNAKNSTFTNVVGIRNGRSLVSTDPGADGIVVDGFLSIDNGLDEIIGQHKNCLHFEFAKNCIFKNGRVIYTSAYNQGNTTETYAIFRSNASVNCVFKDIDVLVQSTANGRLLLGVVDTTNGTGNSKCGAYNITVDSTAVQDYQLMFWNYDGSARYDLTGNKWRGFQGIRSQVAGGLSFGSIKGIRAEGPGPGQFITSDYNTLSWEISDFHISGYSVAFNLAGFRDSKIHDGRISNAYNNVFFLPTVDAQSINQPNGGCISEIVIDGNTGYILQTRNQTDRPLLVAGLKVDGNAVVGLDCSGSVGSNTAKVKAIGNLVGGSITTLQQNGTNSSGTLNANFNNAI